MLLAPFTVRIPPGERDPELAEKLWDERPAILRWCLDGCLLWQRDGLAPPACVRDATDEYFRSQDTFGEWLEDATEDADDHAFTRISALFSSWKAWCEERNIKPGSTMALSGMLEDRGYEKRRESHTGQRGFARIVVKKAMSRDRAGDRSDRYSGYPRHARARDVDNRRNLSDLSPDEFRNRSG